MSTQEKVHGLGLKVPDLTPYASGSCIPLEGDGTPAAMKLEGMFEGLSHRPQVLLQLALQCKMMSCRHRADRTLLQHITLDSPRSEYLTGKLPQSLCTCCIWPHNQERCRHRKSSLGRGWEPGNKTEQKQSSHWQSKVSRQLLRGLGQASSPFCAWKGIAPTATKVEL